MLTALGEFWENEEKSAAVTTTINNTSSSVDETTERPFKKIKPPNNLSLLFDLTGKDSNVASEVEALVNNHNNLIHYSDTQKQMFLNKIEQIMEEKNCSFRKASDIIRSSGGPGRTILQNWKKERLASIANAGIITKSDGREANRLFEIDILHHLIDHYEQDTVAGAALDMSEENVASGNKKVRVSLILRLWLMKQALISS
jgi:hypothetical protein